MTRFLAVLATVVVAGAPAAADDERSEHTAVLVGADADTLGVKLSFDKSAGWSMDVRAKPGADVVTSKLVLPTTHGHYIAYVSPGRESIAFVALSAGAPMNAKQTFAWVYSPAGTLLREWTLGAVVPAADLEDTRVSMSHYGWAKDGFARTKAGIEFTTRTSKRTVVLAADATTFR
jgi:hypothetical protein